MDDFNVLVAQIEEVQNHPNADRLETIRVFGWWTIVSKGMYKVGDLVSYVPIDSVFTLEKAKELGLTYMLNTDQTELRSGGRVKTIRLRQYVSQGLVLPVPKGAKLGDDVKDFYGITKYEPPAPKYQIIAGQKTGKKRRGNPYFKEHNKAKNVKYYQDLFEDGEHVVITEKIHGSSFRAGYVPYVPVTMWEKFVHGIRSLFLKQKEWEFVYGSHRVQISGNTTYKGFYGSDVYGEIARKYDLAKRIPQGYVVYGEIFGPKIQDLTYGLKEIELVVFDIMESTTGRYLDFDEVVEFCHRHSLPVVPLLYDGKYYQGLIQGHTDGKSTICPTQIREGCIIKSFVERNDPRVGRKTLKSVSQAYLLRDNATEFH